MNDTLTTYGKPSLPGGTTILFLKEIAYVFLNEGTRAIVMRHVFNPQKISLLVPFLTTKETSCATLDSTILSGRSKCFFRHLELQIRPAA